MMFRFRYATLASFRQWLQAQDPSLAHLNEVWQTDFATWADVRPFTTDQIKARMASNTRRSLPSAKPGQGGSFCATESPGSSISVGSCARPGHPRSLKLPRTKAVAGWLEEKVSEKGIVDRLLQASK